MDEIEWEEQDSKFLCLLEDPDNEFSYEEDRLFEETLYNDDADKEEAEDDKISSTIFLQVSLSTSF